MISKPLEKYINSLRVKKYRLQSGVFIAEGEKTVNEILNSEMHVEKILFTKNYCKPESIKKLPDENCIMVEEYEMKKVSGLVTPSPVLALVKIPDASDSWRETESGFHLFLDGLQDPGNLGTIIRVADWFGFGQIFYSQTTADPFQPKVIQGAMGSICRIKLTEVNTDDFLKEIKLPLIGTDAKSPTSIYNMPEIKNAIVVIGNEGNGISAMVLNQCKYAVSIPGFGKAESLNVAVAAGIVCAALRKI